MGKQNDERKVKVTRVIKLYNDASESFQAAHNFLLEDEQDSTGSAFTKAFAASDFLYGAVEESLRIILTDNSEIIENKGNTTYALCKAAWKYLKDTPGIDLACLVIEKKERNNSIHRCDMVKLSRLVRVFRNLKTIILAFIDGNAILNDISDPDYSVDFSTIFFESNKFEVGDCSYLLIADPMHDMPKDKLSILTSLPWDIVVDFDGASKEGGLRSTLGDELAQRTVDIYFDRVSRGTNPDLSMFRSGKTVWYYMERRGEVIPELIQNWRSDNRKQKTRDFIETAYEAKPSFLYIVCLKRYDEAVRFLIESLADSFPSIKVILINQDDLTGKSTLESLLPYESFSFHLVGLDKFLTKLKDNQRLFITSKPVISGAWLPTKEGDKELEVNMVVNLEDYAEILHKNVAEASSGVDLLEVQDQFMRGSLASWHVIKHNYDIKLIDQQVYDQFINRIKERLTVISENPRSRIFTIAHRPGFGGTTLSRRIAWDLHSDYPVLLVTDYKTGRLAPLLKGLYDWSNKGIFIVADENILGTSNLGDLEKEISGINNRPIVLLSVRRQWGNSKKDNNILPLELIEDSPCKLLEERYISINRHLYTDEELHRKKEQMNTVLKGDMLCPFIIGLYYLEKDFIGVKDYVEKFISKLENEKDILTLIYIALSDYFGRKELPNYLITQIYTAHQDAVFKFEDVVEESVKELLVSRKDNNITFWRPRHYLIGYELMVWLMGDRQDYNEEKWKNRLSQFCLQLIDLCKQTEHSGTTPIFITELLSDLFINRQEAINPSDEEDGRFAKIIDILPEKEQRLEILKHLTNTFDSQAHFWGHLARYYSIRDKNFEEADICCTNAIQITEKSEQYDPVIYHMKGDCVSKEAYLYIGKSMEAAEIAEDSMVKIRELVDSASYYFDLSKKYGQVEYACLSQIGILLRFINLFIKYFKIQSPDDLTNLNEPWVLTYVQKVKELFTELNKDDLNDKEISIYERYENRYYLLLFKKSYSEVIQNLTNQLDKMKGTSDFQRKNFIRRSIIDTIIRKHNGNLDKISHKDKERILELIKNCIDDGDDSTSNYILWIKIAKGMDKSVDKAIQMVRKWYNMEKEKKIRNPQPFYYMFVLHFLREIEGFVGSIELARDYLKECRDICAARQRIGPINITKVRDWFGIGKGLEKLIDGKTIVDNDLSTHPKLAQAIGIFTRWEHDGKGYISYEKVENIEVFFKPSEAKLGKNQQDHRLTYRFGFSYDGLIAYNRSIRDLSLNESKTEALERNNDNQNSIQNVKKGDIVTFFPKEIKSGTLLIGSIQGTASEGSLHISEISYDGVTQKQFTNMIGTTVSAVVIEVESKYNKKRYKLSVKKRFSTDVVDHGGNDLLREAFKKAEFQKKKKR